MYASRGDAAVPRVTGSHATEQLEERRRPLADLVNDTFYLLCAFSSPWLPV